MKSVRARKGDSSYKLVESREISTVENLRDGKNPLFGNRDPLKEEPLRAKVPIRNIKRGVIRQDKSLLV